MAKQQIFSPLPGIFYRKPSPDKPVYKADGDAVAIAEAVREAVRPYLDAR